MGSIFACDLGLNGKTLPRIYIIAAFSVRYITVIFRHPVTKDTDRCLFHVIFMEISHKFIKACQWAVISGFRSILFVKHVERWITGCQKITAMHVALNVAVKSLNYELRKAMSCFRQVTTTVANNMP